MPNVYIGEEKAVYKESLAEGLPSRIHRVYIENEMGRLELLVPVNKNLEPKYEIQVPYMNRSNVLGEH